MSHPQLSNLTHVVKIHGVVCVGVCVNNIIVLCVRRCWSTVPGLALARQKTDQSSTADEVIHGVSLGNYLFSRVVSARSHTMDLQQFLTNALSPGIVFFFFFWLPVNFLAHLRLLSDINVRNPAEKQLDLLRDSNFVSCATWHFLSFLTCSSLGCLRLQSDGWACK